MTGGATYSLDLAIGYTPIGGTGSTDIIAMLNGSIIVGRFSQTESAVVTQEREGVMIAIFSTPAGGLSSLQFINQSSTGLSTNVFRYQLRIERLA